MPLAVGGAFSWLQLPSHVRAPASAGDVVLSRVGYHLPSPLKFMRLKLHLLTPERPLVQSGDAPPNQVAQLLKRQLNLDQGSSAVGDAAPSVGAELWPGLIAPACGGRVLLLQLPQDFRVFGPRNLEMLHFYEVKMQDSVSYLSWSQSFPAGSFGSFQDFKTF